MTRAARSASVSGERATEAQTFCREFASSCARTSASSGAHTVGSDPR